MKPYYRERENVKKLIDKETKNVRVIVTARNKRLYSLFFCFLNGLDCWANKWSDIKKIFLLK